MNQYYLSSPQSSKTRTTHSGYGEPRVSGSSQFAHPIRHASVSLNQGGFTPSNASHHRHPTQDTAGLLSYSRTGQPQRPSPELRCYEHGCDGRTFSSTENYKRHLREKNGLGMVECELCRKQFTRKSNMDKHIMDGKCSFIREVEQTAFQTTPGALAGTSLAYLDANRSWR